MAQISESNIFRFPQTLEEHISLCIVTLATREATDTFDEPALNLEGFLYLKLVSY